MSVRLDTYSFAALCGALRDFIHPGRTPERSAAASWGMAPAFSGRGMAPAFSSLARRRIFTTVVCLAVSTAVLPDSSSAHQHAAEMRAIETSMKLRALALEAERFQKEEILWLARAIYSETKRPHEQELVAWVVRNRVETRYRGNATYQEAVLDRYQFSAFNPNTLTRTFYTGLDWNSTSPGFQTALSIAFKVVAADERERPFSTSTRHFYSARSMVNGKVPAWASDRHPVELDRPIDAERFRFYERIA